MMKFVKALSFLLLFVALQPVRAQEAAPPPAVAWKLLPEAQVDGSGIYLDEIVTVSGAQTLPHVCVARAPHVGETVKLTRAEIASFAQRSAAGLALTNGTGAAEVHVTRRVHVLEDADLIELLTATLQKGYVKNQGELELHITRAGPRPEVPDEPLALTVTDLPAAGVSPDFVVSFELWAGKERIGGWQMPVKAAVWREIPVAQSSLQRGEPVKEADIALQRADVLVQRDAFLNYPTTDDNLELTEEIQAGRPVLNRDVRNRPLVQRGEMVEGVFQDGSLDISLMVETLEDGALGQTVRVRNPMTKRELHGKVENEKTIRINL